MPDLYLVKSGGVLVLNWWHRHSLNRYSPLGVILQFRIRTLLFFFTLACILAAGVAFVMSVYRIALDAEDSLQAFFQAYNPTIEFVEANNGDWPESWDDLSVFAPRNDYGWVEQHVEYNFDANPEELAKLTPDGFNAIKNKRSYYNFESEIQILIDTLKKYHSKP